MCNSLYAKKLAIAFCIVLLFCFKNSIYSEELSLDPLFRFPMGGIASAGPVVSGKRLWVLSESKILYSISTEGLASGKRNLASKHVPFMIGDPFERLAIVEDNNTLSLINKAGQEVWKTKLKNRPAYCPFFSGDGRLYVPFDSSITVFAPNGKVLWQKNFSVNLSVRPILGSEGSLLLALADGNIKLFSADGELLYEAFFESPAVAFEYNTISYMLVLKDSSVLFLDKKLNLINTDLSKTNKLDSLPVALASTKGGFYILNASGSLVALNLAGKEEWRLDSQIKGKANSIKTFEDRIVLLSPYLVRTYGLDGSLYRELKLSSSTTIPQISDSGTIYVGASDWILYAYKFELPQKAIAIPKAPSIELNLIEKTIEEEAFWTINPHNDDTVQNKLNNIEKMLKSGTIGDGLTDARAYCVAIAMGKMPPPQGIGAARQEAMPKGALVRVKACQLLGLMGMTDALSFLAEVFLHDTESAVKSAAANAIAEIGLDPEGKALRIFAIASEKAMEEQTALAAINAILALYRANGKLDDLSGVQALLRFSGGNYPYFVRDKAEKAIKQFKRP